MATLPQTCRKSEVLSPVCHNNFTKLQNPTENCSWNSTEEDVEVSKIKVPCAEEDCDWESREVVREAAQILLDAHIKLKHLPVQSTPTTIATLPVLLVCTLADKDYLMCSPGSSM